MMLAAAFKVVNHRLAYLTAVIGIPLAVVATLLLVGIDLDLIRSGRTRRVMIVAAIVLLVGSLAFMFYRFNVLKVS